MILSSHLLHTPACWVHIRDVGNFPRRWARLTPLLLAIRAVCRLNAINLVLWVCTSWLGGRLGRFWRLRKGSLLLGRNVVHDAGDFHELGLCEFSKDGLEFRPLNKAGQLKIILGTVLHISVSVTGVLYQVTRPDTLLTGPFAALVGELDSERYIDGGWRK